MDEKTKITLYLADGSTHEGELDPAENYCMYGELDREQLEGGNLKKLQISENGAEPFQIPDPVVRMFRITKSGDTLLKIDTMTDREKLQEKNKALEEENAMLTECILEMSEIIYGE